MLLETFASDGKDIVWLRGFEDGLKRAHATRRAVVMKPLGQGLDDFDGW